MPFSVYDRKGELLELYSQNKVSTVVQLVSDEEALQRSGRDLRALYAERGVDVIYLPVPDFGVPSPELLAAGLKGALEKVEVAGNIAVHCNAGIGRTGLFLACLAKWVLHLDGEQAVQWVRQYLPGAVEVEEQIRFVHHFGA